MLACDQVLKRAILLWVVHPVTGSDNTNRSPTGLEGTAHGYGVDPASEAAHNGHVMLGEHMRQVVRKGLPALARPAGSDDCDRVDIPWRDRSLPVQNGRCVMHGSQRSRVVVTYERRDSDAVLLKLGDTRLGSIELRLAVGLDQLTVVGRVKDGGRGAEPLDLQACSCPGKLWATGEGEQGQNGGEASAEDRRDPLGRPIGSRGGIGTGQNMLPEADSAGRARQLLDEIRRRSGDMQRPEVELDYLRRLLDMF